MYNIKVINSTILRVSLASLLGIFIIMLASCRTNPLSAMISKKIPDLHDHVHSFGTEPHNHAHHHKGDHRPRGKCRYSGKNPTPTKIVKKYESMYECHDIHMHGLKTKPHHHDKKANDGHNQLRVVSYNFGRLVKTESKYYCQYDNKYYPSINDCGLHVHEHIHGINTENGKGHKAVLTHFHHHEHMNDHAHLYVCRYNRKKYFSNTKCDNHAHQHRHGAGDIHAHVHKHQNEHKHVYRCDLPNSKEQVYSKKPCANKMGIINNDMSLYLKQDWITMPNADAPSHRKFQYNSGNYVPISK